MNNMSYCQFQNTLKDLLDCEESMRKALESDEEIQARQRLIKVCKRIADDFASEE